jgi:hypothetical protein
MGMFCLNMLAIALELAQDDRVYEDIATKFFEHFLYIAGALNNLGGSGVSLWNEEDGFYYDAIHFDSGDVVPLRIRSLVGLIPVLAVHVLEPGVIAALPDFRRRMRWFLTNRPELARHVASWTEPGVGERRLLSLVHGDRLRRITKRLVDPDEFLSPHGIRSLRRGPVWFPINYLLIEAYLTFHHYHGGSLTVEMPHGSGQHRELDDLAWDISDRLVGLFVRDATGQRPVLGSGSRLQPDPAWADRVPFYEYFDGDNGRGVGASHQTGWTALVAKLLEQTARRRRSEAGAVRGDDPDP